MIPMCELVVDGINNSNSLNFIHFRNLKNFNMYYVEIRSMEGEIMSEKVFGIIKVNRGNTRETLFLTPDRVIVARTSGGFGGMFGGIGAVISEYKGKKKEKEYLELSPESVLTADKKNFAIPKSEITKVELKKRRFGKELNIATSKKKYEWSDKIYEEHKWNVAGLIPEKKDAKLEDYEDILRPIFGEKLSVKK